jgi:hypothetical protein
MFTVEIKINGALIAHIYGRNITSSDHPAAKDLYQYEYYQTETHKVQNGKVAHARDAGIIPLVSLILKDVKGKTNP